MTREEAEAQLKALCLDQMAKFAKAVSSTSGSRYVVMLEEHGAIGTAERLGGKPDHQQGYTEAWEADRLDLTIEYLVIQHPEIWPHIDPYALRTMFNKLAELICPHANTPRGF